jgi:hypothetical protein
MIPGYDDSFVSTGCDTPSGKLPRSGKILPRSHNPKIVRDEVICLLQLFSNWEYHFLFQDSFNGAICSQEADFRSRFWFSVKFEVDIQ